MAQVSPEKKVVRRQVFSFETFGKVSLAKNYVVPQGFKTLQDALAGVGNDESKLVALINAGVLEQAADTAKASNEGWTIAENNAPSTKEYTGEFISAKNVLATARTLAMTIFGMTPEMTKDEKKAKRQQALEVIKNTPALRDGLKNQAIAEGDDDEDEDN